MTLKNIKIQLDSTQAHLKKSLEHLKYSLNKISNFPSNYNIEDLECLETFESFTSRFSRVSDIFCMKFLRSLILQGDPSFKGSLTDYLNESEKLGYISNSKRWWAIRALRNKEAHEYTEEDLKNYFSIIKDESKFIIQEVDSLFHTLSTTNKLK